MKFKYFVLKRVCPQLGVNSVLIRNEEGKNGVFCTNTGGIYINSSKNQDYLYIPSHNISFVAFEIETPEPELEPEPEPEPIKEIVKKVEEKPKTESVKQNNGASIKTNSREVSKARASARKSPRPAKTTRKTTAKNN